MLQLGEVKGQIQGEEVNVGWWLWGGGGCNNSKFLSRRERSRLLRRYIYIIIAFQYCAERYLHLLPTAAGQESETTHSSRYLTYITTLHLYKLAIYLLLSCDRSDFSYYFTLFIKPEDTPARFVSLSYPRIFISNLDRSSRSAA